jgi:hypothetical protein
MASLSETSERDREKKDGREGRKKEEFCEV